MRNQWKKASHLISCLLNDPEVSGPKAVYPGIHKALTFASFDMGQMMCTESSIKSFSSVNLGITFHDAVKVAARAQFRGGPQVPQALQAQVSPLRIKPSRGNTRFWPSSDLLTKATEIVVLGFWKHCLHFNSQLPSTSLPKKSFKKFPLMIKTISIASQKLLNILNCIKKNKITTQITTFHLIDIYTNTV